MEKLKLPKLQVPSTKFKISNPSPSSPATSGEGKGGGNLESGFWILGFGFSLEISNKQLNFLRGGADGVCRQNISKDDIVYHLGKNIFNGVAVGFMKTFGGKRVLGKQPDFRVRNLRFNEVKPRRSLLFYVIIFCQRVFLRNKFQKLPGGLLFAALFGDSLGPIIRIIDARRRRINLRRRRERVIQKRRFVPQNIAEVRVRKNHCRLSAGKRVNRIVAPAVPGIGYFLGIGK